MAEGRADETSEAVGCEHDSRRVDGWYDDHCLRCGAEGYWGAGYALPVTGALARRLRQVHGVEADQRSRPLQDETVLQEAQRLTSRDRVEEYGEALPDAERFAAMASAITGLEIKPEHFPLLMMAVKLSRTSQAPDGYHRDSLVDIAGYARVAERLHDEREAGKVAEPDQGGERT